MKKITEINIINYRAFYNEKETPENKSTEKYKIDLKNGENLLVYGENGSGKSSLFKALQDFFATIDKAVDIVPNIYIKDNPDLSEPEIQISFSEDPLKYKFNRLGSDIAAASYLQNISTSFLSYRDILKTYFLDIDTPENNPNLFNLFIDNLLRHITEETDNTEIIDKLNSIRESIGTFEKAFYELIGENPDKDLINQSFDVLKNPIDALVDSLNISLLAILKPVLKLVNRYLKEYFKLGVKVSIKGEKFIKVNSKKRKLSYSESLFFNIELHGKKLDEHSYQSFLNEARLSALAICIYLAAIKIDSDKISNKELKILFLDDVFIGLDTSNRIPLLKLLQSEDFKGWQIFITTYDRHWFETAQSFLGQKWKSIELFTGDYTEKKIIKGIEKNIKIFELPVLIHEDLSLYKKAKSYFYSFDYYSSGNILRKLLEKSISDFIPETYSILAKDLEGSIIQFFKFYKDCDCSNIPDSSLEEQLYLFKDIVLNPSSHYDLKSPIYKNEVEKAFKIIDLLLSTPKLNRKLILSIGDCLFYSNTQSNYSANYILFENIYKVEIPGQSFRITDPFHKCIFWQKDTIDFCDKNGTRQPDINIKRIINSKIKLSERPGKIFDFIALTVKPDWKVEFHNSQGKSLNELAQNI